jgi:hypothetical protein
MRKIASYSSNSDLVSLVSETSWEQEYDVGDSVGDTLQCEGRSYASKPYAPDCFITHVIYLKSGDIAVDVDAIENLGIQCVELPSVGEAPGHFLVPELKEALLKLMKK